MSEPKAKRSIYIQRYWGHWHCALWQKIGCRPLQSPVSRVCTGVFCVRRLLYTTVFYHWQHYRCSSGGRVLYTVLYRSHLVTLQRAISYVIYFFPPKLKIQLNRDDHSPGVC